MSKVTISGNASGTGTLTIAAPNTNSDITLNLPTTMGTNNSSSVVTTDATGNLGLGVTPSAWESAYKVVQIGAGGSVAFGSSNAGAGYIGANVYADSAGIERYIASSRLAAKIGINTGAFQWFTAPSGTAGAAITFTQAMTLDASGRLGIGSTSPSTLVHLRTSASGLGVSQIFENSSGTEKNWLIGRNNTTGFEITPSTVAGGLTFSTPAVVIDSSGNLLVGTTTNAGLGISFNPGSAPGIIINKSFSGTADAARFRHNGTGVGGITYSNTATAYVTSSDYRLKETIAPMTGALEKVAALKPVTYKWKTDGSDGEGFIAHELAEVCPSAVYGEKDAIDAEGAPKYQGIDTSFLVATLTAAIQELKAIVDAQGAQIAMQSLEIATLTAAVAASKGTA